MKLIIVRHASTINNEKEISESQEGGKLSKKGEKQALALAERLNIERVDVIYCSTSLRCRQTIAPFLKVNGKIPIYYKKELLEKNMGDFIGKPFATF